MNINLTLIGQTIMFAMFVWFCMRFIWPPIVAAMEARKKHIENGLMAAERAIAEQKEAEQKAAELLTQSKNQAAQIIINANKQATTMIEDAKDIAVTEADKIKLQANANIEQQTKKVRNEIKQQVAALVMKGVNVVLEKEVNAKTHQTMLGKLAQTL